MKVLMCVGLVLILGANPARAGTPAEEEDALIRHGIALRKGRDDLGACAEFQRAYDLTHSPRAAAQLGLAEFALGRWDDAEAHVSEALRAPNDPWIGKYRVELDRSLATIKNHVAHVEVIGEPAGAEVSVNGRRAGRLPLPGPVAVSEGQVDIELRAPGFSLASRTVTLSGGQYQRLVMRLEPGSSTVGTAPSLGPDEPQVGAGAVPSANGGGKQFQAVRSDTSKALRVAKWTALGLTGAALAVGSTASIIYATNLWRFTHHTPTCAEKEGVIAVDNLDGTPVPECQNYLDAYKAAPRWMVGSFIAAGVFGATWLVLTLTENNNRADVASSIFGEPAWAACHPTLSTVVGGTCVFHFF